MGVRDGGQGRCGPIVPQGPGVQRSLGLRAEVRLQGGQGVKRFGPTVLPGCWIQQCLKAEIQRGVRIGLEDHVQLRVPRGMGLYGQQTRYIQELRQEGQARPLAGQHCGAEDRHILRGQKIGEKGPIALGMGDRAGVGCGFLIAGIGGGFEAFPKGLLARGLPLQSRKGVSAPRARNQGNIHQSEGCLGPSGIIQCGH